jgi:hypothetical protein
MPIQSGRLRPTRERVRWPNLRDDTFGVCSAAIRRFVALGDQTGTDLLEGKP